MWRGWDYLRAEIDHVVDPPVIGAGDCRACGTSLLGHASLRGMSRDNLEHTCDQLLDWGGYGIGMLNPLRCVLGRLPGARP